MLNLWSFALYFGAVLVMALTFKTPRAWMWIGIGGASFIASSLYWDLGDKQWHPPVTFFCDAAVCLCFHWWAQEKWELGTFACFLTSCFISILMIAGWVPNNIMYASLLELCNWVALFIIGGVGIMDMVAKDEDSFIGSLHSRLHSARSTV